MNKKKLTPRKEQRKINRRMNNFRQTSIIEVREMVDSIMKSGDQKLFEKTS